MTKHFCDRCECVVLNAQQLTTVRGFSGWRGHLDVNGFSMGELCPACVKALFEFVRGTNRADGE